MRRYGAEWLSISNSEPVDSERMHLFLTEHPRYPAILASFGSLEIGEVQSSTAKHLKDSLIKIVLQFGERKQEKSIPLTMNVLKLKRIAERLFRIDEIHHLSYSTPDKPGTQYLLDDDQKAKLQSAIWVDGQINAKVVAQTPQFIGSYAGFDVPQDTQFFIVHETGAGAAYPFSGEKMTVTMAVYRAKDIDDAIALTNRIQAYQGQGHSCGIYSRSDANILKLAEGTRTSRVMVNQPQSASNSGNLWNGMRQTFSLGCGSWGGNGTNNNITWRDLINETWVSKPLAVPKTLPSDEELFGDVIAKLA